MDQGPNPLREDDDDQEWRTWAKDPPCSCSECATITLPLFVFAHFFSTTLAFSVLNQPIAAHGCLISQLDGVRLILTANKWEMGLPCSRLMVRYASSSLRSITSWLWTGLSTLYLSLSARCCTFSYYSGQEYSLGIPSDADA